MRTRFHVVATTVALGGCLAVMSPPATAQRTVGLPLSVHGFLSQAYAKSWTNPVAGIPTEGTFDYRAIALQVGYRLSMEDKLVIQLSHRRLGTSLLEGSENTVRLDWGFYQRDWRDGSVRIGKVPLPRGLFNEVRDVGTALPFYRAPLDFYLDAGETLDGVVAGYRLLAERPWSLQVEAYGGAYDHDWVLQTPLGATRQTIEARDVHGGQVWLETPLPGVRAGIGGMRYHEDGSPDHSFQHLWQVSTEAIQDGVTARAEYESGGSGLYGYEAYYGQVTVRLIPSLHANVQVEHADAVIHDPSGDLSVPTARDIAAGMSLAVQPGVVFKLEGHRFRGAGFDGYVAPGAPAPHAPYVIASVAVGF